MTPTVRYSIIKETDECILIQDECLLYQCMSVTNGAEIVVEELHRNGKLENYQKLFYIDTEGRVDELLHSGPKFDGFKPGFDTLDKFIEQYGE